MKPIRILAVILLLAVAVPAQGHRMRVFAYESQGMIVAETAFGSGRPAKNVAIQVEDPAGAILFTGTTDEEGIIQFPTPPAAVEQKKNLLIIADAGGGHRGTWLLTAAEFTGTAPRSAEQTSGTPSSPTTADTGAVPPPARDHVPVSTVIIDQSVLEETVAAAVNREVAPLKRMLAKSLDTAPTLKDILGGLGYIIGLAGIAAYFQAKRKGDTS